MKRPPDSDIIEQIVTALAPLRRSKTQAQAQVGAKTAIAMLRMEASRPFPNSDSIKKTTRKLHEALEPFGDGQQIPLNGCDRHMMTIRELRSALDWFEHLEGPSSKVDVPKHLAAIQADCLVNEFSQKPPTGGYRVREIAGFLYEAITGEEGAELKRQAAAVRRSWRDLEHSRGR
ncbi:MAG: hypothetical protein CR217_11585 [Beijerinckiaceae bacterium]|nr:MAG: hypothetical protein CR217_11585 [Beijerinckiaceae bacterium]